MPEFSSCRFLRFYCFAGKGQPGLSMGAKKRRILSMVTPCSKTSLVVVCINFWTAKKGRALLYSACLLQCSPRSPLPLTPFSACYYISVLGALQWGKRDLGESGESSRHRRRRRLEDSPSISANSGQTSKIWYNVICLFAAALGSWDKSTLESFVLSVQYDRRGRLAAPDWR